MIKGTIEVTNTATQGTTPNKRNKKVTFKKCPQFINNISRINKTQVDDAHDIDVVMSMYNLLEYSDTYSKTSVNLWQYYRVELALINDNFITDFPEDNNNSNSFKFKQKITGQTTNSGTNDVQIVVS